MTHSSGWCVRRTKPGEPEPSRKHQAISPWAPSLLSMGVCSPCSASLLTGSLTLCPLALPHPLSNTPVSLLWAVACVVHCGLLGLSSSSLCLCHSPYRFTPFESGAVPSGMHCADPGGGVVLSFKGIQQKRKRKRKKDMKGLPSLVKQTRTFKIKGESNRKTNV